MELIALLERDFEPALHERAQSDSAYDARIARVLLELLNALRHEPIGPRLFATAASFGGQSIRQIRRCGRPGHAMAKWSLIKSAVVARPGRLLTVVRWQLIVLVSGRLCNGKGTNLCPDPTGSRWWSAC